MAEVSRGNQPKSKIWLVGLLSAIAGMFVGDIYDTTPQLPSQPVKQEVVNAPETKEVEVKKNPENLSQIVNLKPYYILGIRNSGQYELRTGGTKAWRFNNPNLIEHGDYTRKNGALGSDGKYAIFPTMQIGREIAYKYLFVEDYAEISLVKAFKQPVLKRITSSVKVSTNTKLKDLTEEQRQKIIDVISEYNKLIPGIVTIFKDKADFEKNGW